MRYELIKYDAFAFNFAELIENLFNVQKLETLHLTAKQEYPELFQVGRDSCTEFHKKFYDRLRAGWPEFVNLYEEFIKKEIAPFISGNFLYQATPTFRVHLPENLAVGDFHTDAEFGHPKGEINYIIPLTSSNGTASVWIESAPGKLDYECALMSPGYLILFNGNELRHGNKVNETDFTRISLDFRILPESKYNPQNETQSITRKTKFVLGEYYKLFKQ